ncbi:MAG: ESX secretion-associated protein EspG [Mycobacterium sp.]|nr:ESX secretion-associated protein EspG [Mycobacterium sp.]
MTSFHPSGGPEALIDDVVGVELTVDGMLVVADRLGLGDFPTVLGIRLNIPFPDLCKTVWEQVARDLTAQGVLSAAGQPHPAVADMLHTLSRSDRTLEGRWWRRDRGGEMTRFAVSRRADRHVIAVRHGELVALQRVASKVGLVSMVTAVLGSGEPAEVEPLTALAATLAQCRTAEQLGQFDIGLASARTYAALIDQPASWSEITAGQRHPGGTVSHTEVAAGVLDGPQGRIVSIPRRVNGELYGSFLPGSDTNLARALDGLLEFLPARAWLDAEEFGAADGFE